MLKDTVHVCLVSAQAAPNLLPVVDPDLRPREVILVVSTRMNSRAKALESALRELGLKTSRVELSDEHDYTRIKGTLLQLASQRKQDPLVLNITGGTKLMAFAAQSVAEAFDWPSFYINVDTDEVMELGRGGFRKVLNAPLKLTDYLRAHGYRRELKLSRDVRKPQWIALEQKLIQQMATMEKAIGQLNWLVQEAERQGTLQVSLQRPAPGFHGLLRQLKAAGVLTFNDSELRFHDAEARAFAGGAWLEDHVFRVVEEGASAIGIRDKSANLTLLDESGVKNELDIAFVARNRLFVIECKTARMDGPRAAKANDTLYKLAEICQRVGGLGTRAMLASYRPLKEAEIRLAQALRVEVVAGSALANLRNRLTSWVNP